LALEGTLDGNHLPDIACKVPLVVCITRLVPQKGLHLISHAIKRIEELVSLSFSIFFTTAALSLSLNMMEIRISEIISSSNFLYQCFYSFCIINMLENL
jgi:glycogen synthase